MNKDGVKKVLSYLPIAIDSCLDIDDIYLTKDNFVDIVEEYKDNLMCLLSGYLIGTGFYTKQELREVNLVLSNMNYKELRIIYKQIAQESDLCVNI